jgi:glutathione S-transferase
VKGGVARGFAATFNVVVTDAEVAAKGSLSRLTTGLGGPGGPGGRPRRCRSTGHGRPGRLALVPASSIRLYGIPFSHPAIAVRGMLERKGLPYRYVQLLAGGHPPSLWALGFRGPTVPAMKLPDGRRVQGSLAIARALEEFAPEPSLYPSDPDLRAAAQAAEQWGEATLQSVPRRFVRWGLRNSSSQRRWFAEVGTPFPAPAITGPLLAPIVPFFVWQAKAGDARVRQSLTDLPGLLDEVDRLLAEGVIGGAELGAADFQIGSSVRLLLAMEDVRALVRGRPAEAFALRVVPTYPDVPAVLPEQWLPVAQPGVAR